MKKLILVIQAYIFLFSFNALAQETEQSFITSFLIEGGIEYGGDEIALIPFTSGETQSMKAGQGGFIAVGGQFQFAAIEKLLIRTTLGIKYNTTAAENANIRFTRVPINLMGFWKITEDVRIGVGASAHQNVQLKGDGFIPDLDFESNIGPRVEIGYKWAALTYTNVKYTAETDGNYSAGAIGLSLSYVFTKK